jgi:arginine/lysine/ornithine decarboxylase
MSPVHDITRALRDENESRAKRDREEGPAVMDQTAVPVIDALRAHETDNVWPASMPAHKLGNGAPRIGIEQLGVKAYASDLSGLHGLDNRHESWQVQSTAEQLFAQAVGAEKTLFSTDGSTTSVHTAMHAVVSPGDTLVMARNQHLSAITGLVLSGARPVWVHPDYDDDLELAHGVAPSQLAQTLEQHADAKGVMVVTPTYYGVSSNIRALADLCHARKIPLITDDAWGLAYSFHPGLPMSALESGADIAIGSVHKSVGGLGQTSVISVQGSRVDQNRLAFALKLFKSTSTSSVLLASIDAARHQMVHRSHELIGRSLELAEQLRRQIAAIPGLRLLSEADVMRSGGAHAFDPHHVTFDVIGIQLTGYEAADWLRDQMKIDVELADHRRVMMLVTIGDDEATVARLADSAQALATAHRGGRDASRFLPDMPSPSDLVTEQEMTPRDAFFAPATMVPLRDAVGRIAADLPAPYPPGIPFLVPGERISEAIVEYFDKAVAAGAMTEGSRDPSMRDIRVVDE